MQIGNDQTFYKRIKQLKVLRACFDLPFSKHTLFYDCLSRLCSINLIKLYLRATQCLE